MNDPHVNAIYYTLSTIDDLTFESCPTINCEEATHKFILEKDILTCELKTHFPDTDSAKAFIEPFLRAWEIDSAIKYGREEFRFIYKDADVVDRNPSKNNASIVCVSAQCNISVSGSAKIHVTRSTYPSPPSTFTINPDVETLWFRYNMYLQGKEPLLSMSYFCLSLLEGLAGGRYKVPSTYFIELNVLNKLGELTSERGDLKTARKGKGHSFPSLTGQEISWIEACIKKIIRRLGEPYQSTPSPSMITMLDLPQI